MGQGRTMDCIILIGIKHCGKSTQARLLSRELGAASYDTDDIIGDMTGKSPREIY
ncbi:MAG: shikimate kinase, partial [Treponema sp.]|nr:shikimate kinase [Treponema sp.]